MSTPFDSHSFRTALGTFATGVTIVTTRDSEGRPVGVTANSFNSVSLNPPMVLWSLANTSRSRAAFSASRAWAVHVLSAAQEGLSARFATRSADKFNGLELEEGYEQVPLLTGCVARLQCKTASRRPGRVQCQRGCVAQAMSESVDNHHRRSQHGAAAAIHTLKVPL